MCNPNFVLRFQLQILSSLFQEEKVYVQHRIKEDGAVIWDLIQNQEAWIFVAGSVNFEYSFYTIVHIAYPVNSLMAYN